MKKLFLTILLVAAVTGSVAAGGTSTVLSAADSGPGSLRQTILDASPGSTIGFGFEEPTTITLTSGELFVDKDLEIIADGPDKKVTITRSSAAETPLFRIFHVASGSSASLSWLTITNGMPDNHDNLGFGGGVLIDGGCTLIIQKCIISGNAPFVGGGGSNGGGIDNGGILTVINTTISGNAAGGGLLGGSGGGMANHGTCTVSNSTISDNDRGGILSYAGSLTIVNSTISGNTIFGGIMNSAMLTLTNCTIFNNANSAATPGGGGITNDGTAEGTNCIVAGNSAPNEPDIKGTLTSNGHNLIGNNLGATIVPATGDQIGTAASPIDPMLGSLQDNGGLTETHALLPGSPAIDHGGSIDNLTTDQRSHTRPVDDPAIVASTGGNESDIGAFEMQAGQALNISTRLGVQTGENILVGGFIIAGTEQKKVLIRGIGPSLNNFGITDALPNPYLELHHESDTIAGNADWRDVQEGEILATGLAPTADAEAAILMNLEPGAYTALLYDRSANTGIGLIEVYDLDSGAVSSLANISTRGLVEAGDNVMIGGFIVGGGEGLPNEVIVRAIGPTLGDFGVDNPLQDPELELRDRDGTLVASNDNWKDTQEAALEATGLAPAKDSEAAILQTLTAGLYTAIVQGVDQTTGVALVEVFVLN